MHNNSSNSTDSTKSTLHCTTIGSLPFRALSGMKLRYAVMFPFHSPPRSIPSPCFQPHHCFPSFSLQISCPAAPGALPQCIFTDQMCNGIPDCDQNTDEDPSFCASWECPLGTVKCKSTDLCVPGTYCDGNDDCGEHLQAREGILLPKQVVDGVPEAAADDEDAAFCVGYTCPAGMVKCKDGLQCVEESQLCDGFTACGGRGHLRDLSEREASGEPSEGDFTECKQIAPSESDLMYQ